MRELKFTPVRSEPELCKCSAGHVFYKLINDDICVWWGCMGKASKVTSPKLLAAYRLGGITAVAEMIKGRVV